MRSLVIVPRLQHVHVVPPIRFSRVLRRDSGGLPDDLLRRRPVSGMVPRHAPGLRDVGTPGPRVVLTPLAHVEMHVPPGLIHGLGHQRVGFGGLHPVGVAPVHFHPVYAPAREDLGVVLPMVLRPRATANTNLGTRTGVEAESEVLGVGIVHHCLHSIGKMSLLRVQEPLTVAAAGPAVVQVEVAVACVIEPHGVVGVDGMPHSSLVTKIENRVVRVRGQRYPARPPQRRGARVRGAVVIGADQGGSGEGKAHHE
mmetsp:Transcript_45392/g.103626  ORF Transcript_45392/g.103626 Transcript_45392/m.103626 type:complete len:255 (+) Transcript_45392:824-1588(+)